MNVSNQNVKKLPIDIILKIDSYYNKYITFFNLVLYEIYNPYKTRYNEIVIEFSGKSEFSGKFRWLKLKEYGIYLDKIVTKEFLRPIGN